MNGQVHFITRDDLQHGDVGDQIRGGFIYLEKTKTNEARQIPVSDDLEDILKDIRRKEHLRSEYVFTYKGRRIEVDSRHTFKKAVKRAGLVDFHFHDLRHTFASQLILNGGSLKEVQELLGHKSMTMTLRYAHLTQEKQAQRGEPFKRLDRPMSQNSHIEHPRRF